MTMTIHQLLELGGTPVYSSDGEEIGKVEEIFADRETALPEWIGIGAGSVESKRVLVPVAGTRFDEDAVTVGYAKDRVKDAPEIDSDDEISEWIEQELFAHYGLRYPARVEGDGDTSRSH